MTRPARVLFLLPNLLGGGAERVVVTLLRHLERDRIAPTLVVLDGRESDFRSEIPDDVELVDLGTGRVRHSLAAVVRLVRQRRPDTVFCAISHLNLAVGLIKPLLPAGTRLVARETNVLSEALASLRTRRLWETGIRWLYRRFDTVVCQSESTRQELVHGFGFPPAKAEVIHNPVDVERIHSLAEAHLPDGLGWSEDKFNLVAVGRLSHEKGFDLLINALAQVGDPRLRITILGKGPLRPDLERLVDGLGVRERVHFAGFQSNPYPVIARADALVMSSRFEQFPNVVLEALACGTPVIATPAPGGIFEIAAAQPDCVLTEGLSAEALAAAIRTFDFARTGRRRADVSAYSVKRIAEQYAAVLEKGVLQ